MNRYFFTELSRCSPKKIWDVEFTLLAPYYKSFWTIKKNNRTIVRADLEQIWGFKIEDKKKYFKAVKKLDPKALSIDGGMYRAMIFKKIKEEGIAKVRQLLVG